MQIIDTHTHTHTHTHTQVIGAVKEGSRRAFLAGPRRLIEAVFDCDVQSSSDMLGKAYSVLNKRRAADVC
jgi:translation elongation factor EF-G